MRILRVIATMNPAAGGPCQGIRNSIPPLAKLGCTNEVVCLDDPGETFGADDPFVVHRLGRGRGPWAMSKKLTPWLREHLPDFDAVILHGLWLYSSYALTKVINELRRDGSPAVPRFHVMPHGMLDPWFQRDPSRRLKAIRNWFVWKAVERHTIEAADGMLFTCQRELELARETFSPYRPRAENNVGYGVPSPPDRTAEMDAAFASSVPELGGRPYLLFLSRIHPKKGVDLLLKAYAEVSRFGDSHGSQSNQPGLAPKRLMGNELPALIIAGPLDSAYAKQMQALAKELKLSDVHFPGMLSGDAKWGAFYGCEAFVLPSHQENFGIAVVEALACGKPVLISDQVNICREIETDEAGIVESDTLDGTVRLLQRFLCLDNGERHAMESNARKCFQSRFGVESAAKQMLDAISGG